MILRFGREWPALAALICFYLFLAFRAPAFFALQNLRDLALANVPVLLIGIGMTLVIVVAQIDISVGSLFAVASVLCGLLAKHGVPNLALPFATLVIGCILGGFNGVLVAFVGAPSIVVTLATMFIWRESLRWATGGAWVEGLPASFQWFGLSQAAGQTLIFFLALSVLAVLWWASKHIAAFRFIYATGSNAEAARLAGISPARGTLSAFLLLGALTGLAAWLSASRFSDVPANSGNGLELAAIAAVVVGGTPITGGRGSLAGTLIGVVLLGSIGPALTFLGVNPFWEKAIQGSIILITVLIEGLAARRRHS
jgi:rhamnose transport system permease protein